VSAGHGEAYGGAGPEPVAISPLSPMTMATFSTVFGGTGLILTKMFKYSLFVTLPAAVAVGVAISAAVFTLFYRLFAAVQASSEVELAATVGLPAEVTVAIPGDGVGEVAYVTLGGRYTGIARSDSEQSIARHRPVKIVRVVGNTLYVAPLEQPPAPANQ
jgi:membrane protein implicated in regulation of membrane protease activity